MRIIPTLLGLALTAAPAVAAPLPPLPYCGAGDPGYLVGRCQQRSLTAAEQARQAEWQRVWHVQQLKDKADRVCRTTSDIRLFNPYGGKWASKGDLIPAVADGSTGESTVFFGTEAYAHLVKDCSLGRMAQYAGNRAEENRAFVSSYMPASGPIVGGSVYVRSHTRCNSSKCWPVRAYTRSR